MISKQHLAFLLESPNNFMSVETRTGEERKWAHASFEKYNQELFEEWQHKSALLSHTVQKHFLFDDGDENDNDTAFLQQQCEEVQNRFTDFAGWSVEFVPLMHRPALDKSYKANWLYKCGFCHKHFYHDELNWQPDFHMEHGNYEGEYCYCLNKNCSSTFPLWHTGHRDSNKFGPNTRTISYNAVIVGFGIPPIQHHHHSAFATSMLDKRTQTREEMQYKRECNVKECEHLSLDDVSTRWRDAIFRLPNQCYLRTITIKYIDSHLQTTLGDFSSLVMMFNIQGRTVGGHTAKLNAHQQAVSMLSSLANSNANI